MNRDKISLGMSFGSKQGASLRRQLELQTAFRGQYESSHVGFQETRREAGELQYHRELDRPYTVDYFPIAASLSRVTPVHLAPHVATMQWADRYMPRSEDLYWERQMQIDANATRGPDPGEDVRALLAQGYSLDDALELTGHRASRGAVPRATPEQTSLARRTRRGVEPGAHKSLWALITDEDAEERVLAGRPAYMPAPAPVALERPAGAAFARDRLAQPSAGTRGVSHAHVQARPRPGVDYTLTSAPFAGESALMTIANTRRIAPEQVKALGNDARLMNLVDLGAKKSFGRFQ